MSVSVEKFIIECRGLRSHAMLIRPPHNIELLAHRAVFTHGYTASKRDVLPWAFRLAEEGMPCLIFDLPGHYLGHYFELDDFKTFIDGTHYLFVEALGHFEKRLLPVAQNGKLVLGGHSLGALMAFRASNLIELSSFNKILVGMGFGMSATDGKHIFQSRFYRKTLLQREQLVSPCLRADAIFEWINQEKENIKISAERVHLITGEDDVVVGHNGTERLRDRLQAFGIATSMVRPKRLPHHRPDEGAVHVYSELRDLLPIRSGVVPDVF